MYAEVDRANRAEQKAEKLLQKLDAERALTGSLKNQLRSTTTSMQQAAQQAYLRQQHRENLKVRRPSPSSSPPPPLAARARKLAGASRYCACDQAAAEVSSAVTTGLQRDGTS